MSKRVLMWVGAYVAAVAVFAAGMVLLARDDDEVATAAAPGEQALMAFPSAIAVGRSQVAVGDVTSVSVGATPGGDVASIDLYDGGRKVATVEPTPGALVTQVPYPALSVGPHALHAAVTDATGEVALTPVTTVDVKVGSEPVAPVAAPDGTPAPTEPDASEPVGDGTIQVPVPVQEGETAADLAARLAVDPGQIRLAPVVAGEEPSTPDEGAELVAGTTVIVAVAPDAGLAELLADEPIVQQVPPARAEAFSVAASVRGCTISLTPTNAPGSVDYFEAGPSGLGWVSVGSGRKASALELRQSSPGTHVYFARSGDDEAAPVAVLLPFSCSADIGWTGDARIDDGILTVDPAALSRLPLTATTMSVYLQVDGGTASLIGGVAAASSVDLRGRLPRLSGKKLDVQVNAVAEIPMNIANGALRVPDGTSMADIVGQGTRVALRVRDPQGAKGAQWEESKRSIALDHDDLSLTFDWTSDLPGVEEALWQIVRYDQQGKPVAVASSADALAGGISKGQPTSDGRSTGTFTIDTAKIPGHEIVAQRRAELDQNAPLTPEPASPPYATVTPAFVPATLADLGPATYASLATSANDASALAGVASWQPLPMPGERVRVQVLIDPNGSAPGPWTQEYAITLPTPQPAETAAGGITLDPGTLQIDPGFAPDPGYARCGVVTVPTVKPTKEATTPGLLAGSSGGYGYAGPDADEIAWTAMNQLYPGGSGVYCMPPPKPPKSCSEKVGVPMPELACDVVDTAVDVLSALAEAALGVYDTISQAYSSAIDVVVQLVSVGNPLCIALKEASPEAGSGCESGFAVAGRAAITVVLASVGLPPALPSLKELEAIAAGDLAQLGRELMAQFIPCDSISTGPAVSEAIVALSDDAGAQQAAAFASDPCLAMLEVMLAQVRSTITAGLTSSISSATGLPRFSFPGFSITPDPRTKEVPTTVRYQSQPTEFDAQIDGAACRVVLQRGPKGAPFLSAIETTPLTLTPGARTLTGGREMTYGLYSNTSPAVLAGQTITVRASGAGGCKGGEATGSATIPALPR